MLTFTCDICAKSYPATVTFNGKTQYDFEGQRIELIGANDDCGSCKKEIAEEEEKIKAQARLNVKTKKQVS